MKLFLLILCTVACGCEPERVRQARESLQANRQAAWDACLQGGGVPIESMGAYGTAGVIAHCVYRCGQEEGTP